MSVFLNPLDPDGAMEPIQRHLDENPDTDAGEIADDILDWLELTDPAAFSQEDAESLSQMLALLRAASPDEKPEDTDAALEAFHRKYALLFEETPASRSSDSPIKKRFSLFRFPRKTAVAAAAAAIMLGCMVTVQAFGVNWLGMIARWTEELFQPQERNIPYAVVMDRPLKEGETVYYDSLKEAVEAFGITEPLAPEWIPERFAFAEAYAWQKSSGVSIYAKYEDADGVLQIFYNEANLLNMNSVEKDSDTIKLYSAFGVDHFLMIDRNREKVFWQNGDFACEMTGDVSKEELKKIIDSIYKGE